MKRNLKTKQSAMTAIYEQSQPQVLVLPSKTLRKSNCIISYRRCKHKFLTETGLKAPLGSEWLHLSDSSICTVEGGRPHELSNSSCGLCGLAKKQEAPYLHTNLGTLNLGK